MERVEPLVYPESHYRDLFAAQYDGETEVRVPFGRVDVVAYISLGDENRWGNKPFLGALAVEVEPLKSWQHGVRQALAYAAQLSEANKPFKYRPAVAIYGDLDEDTVRKIRRQTRKLCTVFLYRDQWRHIDWGGG